MKQQWSSGQRVELNYTVIENGESVTEWRSGTILSVLPQLGFVSVILDDGGYVGGSIEKLLRPLEKST